MAGRKWMVWILFTGVIAAQPLDQSAGSSTTGEIKSPEAAQTDATLKENGALNNGNATSAATSDPASVNGTETRGTEKSAAAEEDSESLWNKSDSEKKEVSQEEESIWNKKDTTPEKTEIRKPIVTEPEKKTVQSYQKFPTNPAQTSGTFSESRSGWGGFLQRGHLYGGSFAGMQSSGSSLANSGMLFGVQGEYILPVGFGLGILGYTGQYSAREKNLTVGSDSILFHADNQIGVFGFAADARYYHTFLQKLNVGAALGFGFHKLQGPNYDFGMKPGLHLALLAYYELIPRLELGGGLMFDFWGSSQINYNSQAYSLSEAVSGSSRKFLLQARFRVF